MAGLWGAGDYTFVQARLGPLHLGCNREVAALLRWLLTQVSLIVHVCMCRISDDRLPRVVSPNHSMASEQSKKPSILSTSLPLPQINCYQSDTLAPPNHSHQAKGSPMEVLQPGQNVFPVPLKQSEITQIVEAAKKSRDEKIAASLGLDRFGRAKRPHRRTQAQGSKFTVFTSPRTSFNKSKQQILPHSMATVASHGNRHGALINKGGTTEVIDLETSDAMGAAVTAVEGADVQQRPSISLQGQNTRSQPHLTTKKATITTTASRLRQNRNQKLRRPRSHTRMGPTGLVLHTASRLTTEQAEGHTISVSMEDVSGKVSPVQKEESKPPQEPTAPEKKGGSISRPLVKRPNFVKLNSTKQSVKSQVHSVYSGRPYVIPVAKKILQQTKSTHHMGGHSMGGRTSKRLSLSQYPSMKRRHQPLQRKEIPMPKGKLWLGTR